MQVQYSLIDRRPYSSGLTQYCMKQGIAVLAYGVLAGGFLTDEWLNKPLPSMEVCAYESSMHGACNKIPTFSL